MSKLEVLPTMMRGYLSSKEAAVYLSYPSLHAFTCAYPKLGIRPYRLGRLLRFKVEDLDAALKRTEVEPIPVRRRKQA